MKFVDIHQHVAFGIDDGARNFRRAKLMIDASYRAGISTIISTPHVRPGKRAFDTEAYLKIIDKLNQYCSERNYDMRVLPGAEVFYTDATIRLLNEGYIPTLNRSEFVLVEWPVSVSFAALSRDIRDMTNAGYIPVIAHIERYRGLWFAAKRIQQLRSMYDFRIQIDCDALLTRTSIFERMFVNKLLKIRLIDYLATDAHNVDDRGITIKEAYKVVKRRFGRKYARQLTYSNQCELLGDE